MGGDESKRKPHMVQVVLVPLDGFFRSVLTILESPAQIVRMAVRSRCDAEILGPNRLQTSLLGLSFFWATPYFGGFKEKPRGKPPFYLGSLKNRQTHI